MKNRTTDIAASEKLTNAVEVTRQEQAVEPANVSENVHDRHVPEMDEKDIAEMSIIAAEIESAESFNLTFETVDTSNLYEDVETSDLRDDVESKDSIKSAELSNSVSGSDSEEIEELLGRPVVEKSNTSLADALLNEWGSPMVDSRRMSTERRSSDARRESNTNPTSTPKGREPFKDLKNSASSIRKAITSSRKRISRSSNEGDCIPPRKRCSSSSKMKTGKISTESNADCTTPYHEKGSVGRKSLKKPLKILNI